MPDIVVPLPTQLVEALERVAAETGESLEALIARAVEEQMRKRMKLKKIIHGNVFRLGSGK